MTPEKTDQLVRIAPYMFRYEGWNNIQNSLMGFGFECGDGWYDLLADCVRGISKIDVNETVRVQQVKEKFGSLRFYYQREVNEQENQPIDKEIQDYVDAAEARSEVTCERCGAPAEIKGYGWLRCECDACRIKREEERAVWEKEWAEKKAKAAQ